MNVLLSEKIKGIIARNMTAILNNTIPEKREETDELLKSTMLEIDAVIEQVMQKMRETENAINKLVEKMKENTNSESKS